MATNTHLKLAHRAAATLPGSEAAHLAAIGFGGGWARARQDYTCDGRGPAHTTPAGVHYFVMRLASGTVHLCRACADAPHTDTPAPDPFDFGGAA